MKQVVLWAFIFLFASCSSIRHARVDETVKGSSSPRAKVDNPEILAVAYMKMAQEAQQIGDTLGADYYFSKAMDIVDSLRADSLLLNQDSTVRKVVETVSLEYARYLSRLNGIEQDTLTAANVMRVLDELEEGSSRQNPDSTILIPDVIEQNEMMAIPLVLNQKVEKAIHYFQTKGRRVFTRWLQRSGRYKKLITRILREEGVPDDLFYLAMIESGFNPYARSYARAVGIWQFIYSTGRAYGLRRSWWYDERRDPEKSTRAAARHLKDLYERFNNWYLAIAGYNFSPRKIEKRIKRYNVDEFWELPRLPRQTRNYVPTFIAAALIAKNPEKYGFYVTPDPPIEYDTVTVRETVDLNVVARCTNSTFDEIKKLNPALLRFCTPPDVESWVLNIPKGTRELFLKNYARVPDNQKLTWIRHRIRSGETLSTIARRYGVSVSEIKRFNKIRGSLIRAGHSLVIPVPQNKKYLARVKRHTRSSRSYRSARRSKPVTNVPGRIKEVHIVRRGETLWDISRRYGVTVSQIRRWNGLGRSRLIHPGDTLNIWIPAETVTLAAKTNSPASPTAPAPSGKKNTGSSSPSRAGKVVYHTVQPGDNLWDIAQRYGVSIRDIKRWNNRRSNLIKPGDQLKIILPE